MPRLELPLGPAQWADRLLDWYRDHRRALPWRDRPEPYRVWVSEIMLQQTQVKAVLPYYERFLKAFPSIGDLAQATEEEVVAQWSGLGYYRRARNLHAAARIIRDSHDGRFPNGYEEVAALPGIGRYTAGAILSIAFSQPYPIVDGNVRRVMARLLRIEEPLRGPVLEALWQLLESCVNDPGVRSRVSDFNQALMEWGALVCTPRNPDCGACPLAEDCSARTAGLQDQLPVRSSAAKTVELEFVCAVVQEGERFLMRRNDEGPFLRGFWEFPKLAAEKGSADFARGFSTEHDLCVDLGRPLKPVRHQITFRRMRFYPMRAHLREEPRGEHWSWIDPSRRDVPIPAYVRKIVSAAQDGLRD